MQELLHCQNVCQQISAGIRGLQTGSVTVGTAYSASYAWISEAASDFHSQYPGMDIDNLRVLKACKVQPNTRFSTMDSYAACAMVEAGLLDEVDWLLSQDLPPSATALQAIGYKEFLAVADGTATEAEAIEEVKLRSRQYAKRQLTWLRRNPDIHWIEWQKERDFSRAVQVSTEILTAAGVS